MSGPLPRTLEPEVMDSPQEAVEYDTMDHEAVNQQFVDDLLASGAVEGDILDLGTGTARIPIAICQRVDDCRIMAVDLSISMLELARYNVEVAGLIERIVLDHADCKQLPYDVARFDGVVSNSIIHHLPDAAPLFREAVRLVRPGGFVFFRDLMRPASQAELDNLVREYAGQENDSQQKMFRESLHAALTLHEVRELVSSVGLNPDDVAATSDRHWTLSTRAAPASEA